MDDIKTEERDVMIDALLDIIGPPADPSIDLELVFNALTEVFALALASGTEALPVGNIDVAATTIGQEIADRAHRFRRLRDEALEGG